MNKTITINVPAFGDDINGRFIVPPPMSLLYGGKGRIIIENNTLTYYESRFSKTPTKTFDLSKISRLLLVRTKHPLLFTRDFKLDKRSLFRAPYYFELFVVYNTGDKYILIPSFIDLGKFLQWQWDRFLNKIKIVTHLPLDKIENTANNKNIT